jgi:hypothetical protein
VPLLACLVVCLCVRLVVRQLGVGVFSVLLLTFGFLKRQPLKRGKSGRETGRLLLCCMFDLTVLHYSACCVYFAYVCFSLFACLLFMVTRVVSVWFVGVCLCSAVFGNIRFSI